MTLKDLIKQENLENSTAAEIVTALNAASVDRTDATLVGPFNLFKKLKERTGITDETVIQWLCDTVCGAFEQASLSSAWMRSNQQAFAASGMNFSDADTRAFIDKIFTGSQQATELGTTLKSLGIYQISKTENAGLGTITEQQATAALAAITAENVEAIQSRLRAYVMNEIVVPLGITTWQQLQAAIAQDNGP